MPERLRTACLDRHIQRNVAITVLVMICALTVMRTLRAPNQYAMGHWLHNFNFGFIPRGLLGDILYPLWQNKSPEELTEVLSFFGWSVLLTLCVFLLRCAADMLDDSRHTWDRILIFCGCMVFFSSPFFVWMGHLAGYFDQIIQCLAILSLWAVLRERYLLVGLLSALALLLHELYIVAGMPMVVLCLFSSWSKSQWRRHLRNSLWVIGPPFIVCVAIAISGTKPVNVTAMNADIARYGIIDRPDIISAHLSHGFSGLLGDLWTSAIRRASRPDALEGVGPSALCLLSLVTLQLVRQKQRLLGILFIGATLLPLAMLLTIWDGDTGRMCSLVIFSAFCGLYAVRRLDPGPMFQVLRGSDGVRPWGLLVIVASLLVFADNWTSRIILMDNEIDREGVFSIRPDDPPPRGYKCGRELFPNSNFESGSLHGWVIDGHAFVYQPIKGPTRTWQRRPIHEGQYWVGSYDTYYNGQAGVQLDGPTGSLASHDFTIDGDTVTFLISGGADPKQTYVALEIEGVETHRATGHNLELMRVVNWPVAQHRGKRARVRIVDASMLGWGHINADGFCYR